jgi:hypothetical protein
MNFNELTTQLLSNIEEGEECLFKLIADHGEIQAPIADGKHYGYQTLYLAMMWRDNRNATSFLARFKGDYDVVVPNKEIFFLFRDKKELPYASNQALKAAITCEQAHLSSERLSLKKLYDTHSTNAMESYYFDSYLERNSKITDTVTTDAQAKLCTITFKDEVVSADEFIDTMTRYFAQFECDVSLYFTPMDSQNLYLLNKTPEIMPLKSLIQTFEALHYTSEQISSLLTAIQKNEHHFPSFVETKYTYAHYE